MEYRKTIKRMKAFYEFFDAGSVKNLKEDFERVCDIEQEYLEIILGRQLTKADAEQIRKETMAEQINQFYKRTIEMTIRDENSKMMVYKPTHAQEMYKYIKEKYEKPMII